MQPKIWILGDTRVGNTNQAIALAEEIGLEYEIKNVRYNFFALLPNLLLPSRPVHVNKDVLKSLSIHRFPELIISSGRRTAILALYLKRKSYNKSKVVQIMGSNTDSRDFDLLVLPQHDNYQKDSQNTIRIIGALSNMKSKLKFGKEEFSQHYPEIKRFIAVIVGGNTKSYTFSKDASKLFTDLLEKIAITHGCILFISFSRRTPIYLKQIIRSKFLWPHVIYDPEEQKPNPYYGMLDAASHIITTADSISIPSEVASTGKLLYIFCPNDFKLKKHKFFIQQLLDLNIARIIDESTDFLETYEYQPLYEVERVANTVKNMLQQNK